MNGAKYTNLPCRRISNNFPIGTLPLRKLSIIPRSLSKYELCTVRKSIDCERREVEVGRKTLQWRDLANTTSIS